jgi:hypothetical protein
LKSRQAKIFQVGGRLWLILIKDIRRLLYHAVAVYLLETWFIDGLLANDLSNIAHGWQRIFWEVDPEIRRIYRRCLMLIRRLNPRGMGYVVPSIGTDIPILREIRLAI